MELTAEQVNTFLSTAVLNSQIGAVVQETVKKQVAELSNSYKNPFEEVIRRQIVTMVENEVKTKYAEQFRVKIQSLLESKLTDDFVNAIVDAGFEKIKRNY